MDLIHRNIRRLETAEAIHDAWPVVRQLRPHLDVSDLVAAWEVQREEGFRAIGAFAEGVCVGFAGYRIQHMLAHGRILYVDDLVTDQTERNGGVGKLLVDWLLEEGRNEGCTSLQLDSGTQRWDAHSFYFKRGLQISAFHFRVHC